MRVNFFVLVALLFVSTGRVSPLASLHQFVINPTLEEQNGTQMVQPFIDSYVGSCTAIALLMCASYTLATLLT